MKTHVEHQRFRVWMPDAKLRPDRAWRIVMRYHLMKTLRSWWVLVPLIVVIVGTVIGLGAASTEWAAGWEWSGPGGMDFTAIASTYFVVALGFVLLIGAPMFSEDLRFHAPLFYFSRPLRPIHYYFGKTSVLLAYVFLTAIVPFLLFAVAMLVLGVPNATPPDGEMFTDSLYAQRNLEEWQIYTVDTFGDWAYGIALTLPAMVFASAFVVSVAGLVSVYTRRFWHTALGIVIVLGGWGMVAAAATEITRSAWGWIGGPFGWFYLMFVLPMSARFDPYTRGSSTMAPDPVLDGWVGATVMSYVLVTALTFLCVWLTLRRLHRQEEFL